VLRRTPFAPGVHRIRERGKICLDGMALALFTIVTAGALGGAIALSLTAVVIIATAVLAVVGIFNGLRMVATHWASVSRD